MKKKPLILIVLCVLHLIEPIMKIVYLKLSTGFSFESVLANITQMQGFINYFEFWILFPLGGIALLRLRKWTYFIFMVVQLYSIYTILFYEKYTWPYVSDGPMFTTVSLVIMNSLVIIYFLLPETRRPFFDKNSRWWEPKERHQTHIPCVVNLGSATPISKCYIKNISLSGAFISAPDHLLNLDEIEIDFKVGALHFDLVANVINKHETNGVIGFGVKFKVGGVSNFLKRRKVVQEIKRDIMRKAISTQQCSDRQMT